MSDLGPVEPNIFKQEADMTEWAAELGATYIQGTQGSEAPRGPESDKSRKIAHLSQLVARMRELKGLPAIIHPTEES